MVQRVLGANQRQKYNKILRNRGRDAAAEYRQMIMGRNGIQPSPAPAPTPSPVPTPSGGTSGVAATPVPTGPISPFTGSPTLELQPTGLKQLDKSAGKASDLMNTGATIGQNLLPEVFAGGKGFDRLNYNAVTPERLDFNSINQYIQPSVNDAQSFRDDTAGRFDELVGMRRAELGGLDTAENQALKESLFRNIDRQRQGAMRDVARTPGLGAGASFAQRSALGRDYGNQAMQAERQLLLDNIALKNQNLGAFEGTVAGRQGAVGNANAALAGLRGLQGQVQQGTQQYNANAGNAAAQFNAQNQLATDQFNAGQQQSELGARIGAVSTGTGLVNDERDRLQAANTQQKMLDFLRELEAMKFNQAQQLFG